MTRRPPQPVPGQLGMFGAEEPWYPTGCYCQPPVLRGCHHCKKCDTCEDCRQCAGRGCSCSCND
ncbi:hypothetical protein [Streptomyces atroolivaceus]|uniref:hypothetical protein n=1 Tax=Streptomyces atroolivaceus TaxID=66869 RepID=UPI003694A623